MSTMQQIFQKIKTDITKSNPTVPGLIQRLSDYSDELSHASGGGGGDSVEVTQIQSTGTKIASVAVNGVGTDLYAPNVSVTQTVSTGTKIGSVNGTDLYAPDISGKADKTDLTTISETGSTASQNISNGTYFYLSGTLVRAKTAISIGDTFKSGTNYETVPICDSLPSRAEITQSNVRAVVKNGFLFLYATGGIDVETANAWYTVTTLPSGYIPTNAMMCPCFTSTGSSFGVARIKNTGVVEFYCPSTGSYYFSMSMPVQ